MKKELFGEHTGNERNCDKTFVAQGSENDTSLFFSSPRKLASRRAKENAVENIRFPQETGEFSFLKIGKSLKAFGT